MGRASAAAILLFAIAVMTPSFSQSTDATVSGVVVDAGSAQLPNVTITATNTATGVATVVITNESGAYNYRSLSPGTYKLSAELPGFETLSYPSVPVSSNVRIRLNFKLIAK